ncbi:LiaF transmembrane domain-containing protein [Alkalicoccus urumqiensis]|uniref:LiaF transmembrane domain-containing protein n=1 Tax=Alkalicoccus urumqiensis TaxID=1548213 RepID=A0A2P6MF75_ALKUR|nr:hypothetical protein [Alkalicoccus urumqiensis]PRO64923.1 hypothetical protein C6I21_12325 [Alkalicoccus urumqiensis]
MKQRYMLPGGLLLLTGLYFLALKMNALDIVPGVLTAWPVIPAGVGILLLLEGFSRKDEQRMFAGTLLTGMGAAFYGAYELGLWQISAPLMLLVIGAAFLVKYSAGRREGLGTALLLLALGALPLLLPVSVLSLSGNAWLSWWPVIPVVLGLYFLFVRR